MPFNEHAKITLTNEGLRDETIYYQVDYTVGDQHPDELGRLHVCFQRANPTTLTEDFELLPSAPLPEFPDLAARMADL